MINNNRRKNLVLRTAIVTALASASGVYAQISVAADGFAIENNELTITGGGDSASFSQSASIDVSGVVDHISDVPSTDGVGIPSFSFELITEGLSDGDYDFRVAVIFDKQGSQSRIEAKIESLILKVQGTTVTGRIPAGGNALRLLGRNGSGALEVQMNVSNLTSNGPVRISGNQITFDGANLIERIRNSNPGFDDIILEEFDDTASYDYRIVVQQKAGAPENVTFSTIDGVTLTALPKVQTGACGTPCVTSLSTFVLNPTLGEGELVDSFTDAFSVTGSFNVVPSVSASPSPSPSPTFEVEEGGGPGGPFPPDPDDFDEEDLNELLEDLESLLGELEFDEDTPPSEEQIALLDEAFGNLAEQLDNADDLDVDQGFTLLASAGQTFERGGDAAGLGGQIDVGAAADTLGGFANVINGMIGNSAGVPLSLDQLNTLTNFTEDKLSSAANMLSDTTSVADVEKMMESTAELLNKTLEAGADLSPELIASAVQIALKAVSNITGDVVGRLGLAEVFPEGFDVNNQSQVQELMRTQPSLLSETIRNTPAISAPGVDQSAALGNLAEADGISLESAQRIVAALGNITNPGNVALPGGQTATGKLLSALNRAFGGGTVNAVLAGGLNLQSATSFAVDVDAVTGALRVRADSESYAATSTAVRLVPTSIPEGISYLADGRAVAVADGVAIELAPAAADLLGFAAATERAGFPASFRNDGSVSLNLGNNQRFAGTFAYDNIGGSTGNCGAITFTNPTGAVNAASYAFTVRCANGITQRIVPFIDNTAFYTTVANAGLTVRTDRNTGAITIGNVGRFKPSFFVTPLTTADQTFLTQVGTNGFAFRSRDLNADGRADYEVITASGVQAMYAMP